MNDEVQPRRRGFELQGWHVLLALAATFVLIFVLFVWTGKSQLNRKMEELRAKGYPTSFADLEDYRKLPEGVENAARTYVEAFYAYQDVTPEEKAILPIVGTAKPPDPNAPMPADMKAAMEAFLARNQKTLELLHQAGQIEHCRYDLDFRLGVPMSPYLNSLKSPARLLSAATLERAESGDVGAACEYLVDLLHLGRSVDHDPFLIGHLVGIAVHAMGVSDLEAILSRLQPDDQLLVRLDREFRAVRKSHSLVHGLMGEASLLETYAQSTGTVRVGSLMRYTGVLDRNAVVHADFIERFVEAAKLPVRERLETFRAIDQEADDLSLLYVLVKIHVPTMAKVAEIDARVQAQLDSVLAAIAVERYRLAEGRLPERLDELVPKYIEAVPIDPFDGRPLRYRRLAKGYIIYTIGADEIDNGGRGKIPNTEPVQQDFPFRVLR